MRRLLTAAVLLLAATAAASAQFLSPGERARPHPSPVLNLGDGSSNTGQLNINLGTMTSNNPVASSTNTGAINIFGTWNNGGVVFDAPIVVNIANTAYAAGSLLEDLKFNGATKYSVGAGANSSQVKVSLTGGILFSDIGNTFGTYDIFKNGTTIVFDGISDNISGIGLQAVILKYGSFNTPLTSDQGNSVTSSNSTNASGFSTYNTTDAQGGVPTNFERGEMSWVRVANVFVVGTEKGGTGTARNMRLETARHIDITGGTPTANSCAGFALATGSSDATGTITYTSATTCSITFGNGAYTNAPFCLISPGSAASTHEVVSTTTGFTATFGTAQTAFTYYCFGA